MKATEVLKHEHRAVEQMLAITDRISGRLNAGEQLDPEHLVRSVEFFQLFVDRCHHGKEEDLLFREMIAAGMPVDEGPLGVMLSEHQNGRALVKMMSGALDGCRRGDRAAGTAFAASAGNYSRLLRAHIQKEDNVLYAMADNIIGEERQEELVEAFEMLELERMGQGTHQRLHDWIHELQGIYG